MDLKLRKQGIGGSDVAPILGLSRFSTAVDVWQKKISDSKELVLKPDDSTTSLMYWGKVLEKPIIDAYAEVTNNKIVYGDEIDQLSHPDHSWLIANVDGFAFRGYEKILLEAKYSQYIGKEWGAPWTDKIPVEYTCQIQHYLHVCGLNEAHVPVWSEGILKIYVVKRDDAIIDRMLPDLRKFWHENVLKLVPPEPQNSSDVKILYPRDSGSEKIATKELASNVAAVKLIDDQVKKLKQEREKHITAIGGFLKDSSKLVSNDGLVLARFSMRKDGKRVMRIA